MVKNDQIPWMFSFLIDEIGLDPQKLYITTFIGDSKNNVPKDTESVALWQSLFNEKNIYHININV